MSIIPRNVKYLPELFDHIVEMDREDQITALHEFVNRSTPMSLALFEVYRFTYHPKLVADLPEGAPPIREMNVSDYSNAPMNMFMFFKNRVKYWYPTLERYITDTVRRETNFIQTIEGLYERDIKLALQIKDKELSEWPGIDRTLFDDAFPSWTKHLPESDPTPPPVIPEMTQEIIDPPSMVDAVPKTTLVPALPKEKPVTEPKPKVPPKKAKTAKLNKDGTPRKRMGPKPKSKK